MEILEERDKLLSKLDKLSTVITKEFDSGFYNRILLHKNSIKDELTFNILCLGDFSSGKSTFINNFFIGEDLLPTHDTTTTARLTTIKKGASSLKIYKSDDNIVEEYYDDFKTILSNSVAKDGVNIDITDKVELNIETELLEDGIVIVDSPGLNDPEIERMNVTYQYVNNADCIIYLIHSQQQYKENEKKFLEENIYNKNDLDKIIFVMNFWDKMPENQRKATFQYVKKQIDTSIEKIRREQQNKNIETPKLFAISSITKENFSELENELKTYLSGINKESIVHKKILSINNFIDEIIQRIDEKIKLNSMTMLEIDTKINDTKNDLIKYQDNLDAFNSELTQQIEDEFYEWLKILKNEYNEITEFIVNTIQNRLIYIDSVETFQKQLKYALRKSIQRKEDSLDASYKDFMRTIKRYIENQKATLNISSSKIIDINILTDTIDYADLYTFENIESFRRPDNLLKIIPQYLMHILNNRSMIKEHIIQDIQKNIDELEMNIDNEFKLKIAKLRNNMDDIIQNIIKNTNSNIKQEFADKMNYLEQLKRDKEELNLDTTIETLENMKQTCIGLK